MKASVATMLLAASLAVPILEAEETRTIVIKGARLIDGRSDKGDRGRCRRGQRPDDPTSEISHP